jgi:hypothetical protein
MKTILAIVATAATTAATAAPPLPPGFAGQLPSGYEVLANVHLSVGHPLRSFEIVALGRKDEEERAKSRDAPARPLLVFERKGGRFVQTGRNDHVVFKADEGGQCDPFLDGDATIAVKGRYFTVQNGVACGEHWTDYITFRLDDHAGGFVFDNARSESWTLNPSNDPNAEALVREGKPRVVHERPGHVTPFAAWRPEG